MRFTSALLTGVCVACALSVPIAADVVHVPFGSSLQAAVAAAQPGDTLLIGAGGYTDASTLVIDKSLTLIGTPGGSTTYKVLSTPASATPLPLIIRDIDASEEVRIVGLAISSHSSQFSLQTVMRIENCAGPVVLSGMFVTWTAANTVAGVAAGSVEVRDCAQLTFTDFGTFAFAATQSNVGSPGTPGLYIENSNVSLLDSDFRGGLGQAALFGTVGGDGAPALHAVDSLVRIGRSTLRGGDGRTAFLSTFITALPGDGAPAILAQNSSIHVHGGPANTLRGGRGTAGAAAGQPVLGSGAPAVQLDASSTLRSASDVQLVAGPDGTNVVTQPLVSGGAWILLGQRLASLRTQPELAQFGGSLTNELSGEPFGVGFVSYSALQSPALVLPGISGALVLHLGSASNLPPFALGATGVASQVTPLPELPELAGLTLLLQGIVVSPLGSISISAPAAIALLE